MTAEPTIHVLDVHSVVALFEGKATALQQKQAIHWILQEACVFSYTCPDDFTDRQAAVFEGRRKVGQMILQMRDPGMLALAEKRDAELKKAKGAKP